MASPARVDRAAKWSLLLALALAVLGKWIEWTYSGCFWGGLLAAFGEAALVGGLADWFAVRALFVHPFGLPFPHTAIIPRNRQRIIKEIRDLVLNEWLPKPMLAEKTLQFDFVEQAILPAVEPLRPHLREVLRSVGKEVLRGVDPAPLADVLAGSLVTAARHDEVRPFLANVAQKAREQGWLAPLVREWSGRLRQWAGSENARRLIAARLEQATENYAGENVMRRMTMNLAQLFGGLDLDVATRTIQAEIQRFAGDQEDTESPIQRIVRDGLANIEQRLRDEPGFLDEIRRHVMDQGGALGGVLGHILATVKSEALAELDKPETRWLDMALAHLEVWVSRLRDGQEMRRHVNSWCRRLAVEQIERHHPALGVLVEEQMSRLSEERLTAMIQERVGEDLNWIRLNGTFVGGIIGVALYLLFWGGKMLLAQP